MQVITIKRHGTSDRVIATNLPYLRVLEKLAEHVRAGGTESAWIKLSKQLDGFYADDSGAKPTIVIKANDSKAELTDVVTLHWSDGFEKYHLSDLTEMFPGSAKLTEKEIDEMAFEWGVDYKPWETDLHPQDYARYGFEQGAKWAASHG